MSQQMNIFCVACTVYRISTFRYLVYENYGGIEAWEFQEKYLEMKIEFLTVNYKARLLRNTKARISCVDRLNSPIWYSSDKHFKLCQVYH